MNWRNWTRASNREVRVTPPGLPNFRVAFHARPLDQVLADERKDGSFVEVPDDYWDPQLDGARAEEAAALARYENLLREAQFVPAGDGSLERLLASGPALATLEGSDDVVGAFDAEAAAALKPAPFPGEEFDARLEERFAQLSAKVGKVWALCGTVLPPRELYAIGAALAQLRATSPAKRATVNVRYGVKSLVYWSTRARTRAPTIARYVSTGIWSLDCPGPTQTATARAHRARPERPPRRALGRRLRHTRARRRIIPTIDETAARSTKPPRSTGGGAQRRPGPTSNSLRRHKKTTYVNKNARRRASWNHFREHHRDGPQDCGRRRRRQRNAGQDDHDLRTSAHRNRRGPREHRGPPRRGGRGARRRRRRRRRSIEAGARKESQECLFNPLIFP